jgi:hypothetical protein
MDFYPFKKTKFLGIDVGFGKLPPKKKSKKKGKKRKKKKRIP